MPCFETTLLRVKRLPTKGNFPQTTLEGFGALKKNLALFHVRLDKLMPVIVKIVQKMCEMQYVFQYGHWHDHWREISKEGYDIIRETKTDYGNMEYCVIYKFLCAYSPDVEDSMTWLAEYFPTLHPNLYGYETEHSLCMKGDIIKIIMAALRGHDDFRDVLLPLNINKPKMFDELCQVAQTVQYIDAFLRTGYIKFRELHVQTLPLLLPESLDSHEFVIKWLQEHSRHLALISLTMCRCLG